MSITGAADGPPFRLGVAIADIVSGMFAAYGVAMALFARERTGRGQEVDLAMLDSVAALLTYQAGNYFASGKVPARLGNRHPSIVPYETFAASDGDFVLAVGNDEQWRRVLRGGRAAGGSNGSPPTGSGSPATTTLRPFVADRLRTQPRQHWIDALTAAGVPCGSVRNLQELFADPQIARARDDRATIEHATIGPLQALGIPIKLSDTPGAVRTPPPQLGQHTDAVLQRDLGLSADAIAASAPAAGDLARHGNLRRPEATILQTIDRAKQQVGGAARRANDEADARLRGRSSTRIAVPLFRQVANVLRAEGLAVQRVHAVRQRPPDVGSQRRGLHRAVPRHCQRPAAGRRSTRAAAAAAACSSRRKRWALPATLVRRRCARRFC